MDCMLVCMLTVFAFFWLLLEELGMHSGLHVCMNIDCVPTLSVCSGRPWNDHPIAWFRFLSGFAALFCSPGS